MPQPNHQTSLLAIAVAAVLAVGSIVAVAALAASTEPTGAVAAATGVPATPVRTPRPSSAAAAAPVVRATPSPTPTPNPTPAPTPTPASTPAPVLAMNLYAEGDFVSQATKDQCVSAAMQIMLNVIGDEPDVTAATQAQIADLAKALSEARDDGTEPLGWARGLEELGGGGYEVHVAATRGQAIERAVRAIRATGRPAGLLVWRGAHSWVLHGWEATGDPAAAAPMTVTHLWVSDPWYPRVSSIWGESRGPNARITPDQLAEDFLPWRRPTGRYPGMDGAYVIVLPVDR